MGLPDGRLVLSTQANASSIKSLAANIIPRATPTILLHRWDVESTRAGGALGCFALWRRCVVR